MQENTMKSRRTILTLMGAGAAGALAFTSVSPVEAQTATSTSTATSQGVIAAPAPGARKPTTATPAMIDEAIQRSQARTAKAVPATSAAKPEQFGSEEPFTYKPGATAN
jgi:hypothetical protein